MATGRRRLLLLLLLLSSSSSSSSSALVVVVVVLGRILQLKNHAASYIQVILRHIYIYIANPKASCTLSKINIIVFIVNSMSLMSGKDQVVRKLILPAQKNVIHSKWLNIQLHGRQPTYFNVDPWQKINKCFTMEPVISISYL